MAVRRETNDSDNDPAKVGTQFSVRSPHPGFGVDDNIKNELGHTNYPKWVDHPTEDEPHVTTTYLGKDQSKTNIIDKLKDGSRIPKRVLVNNKEEEDALMSGEPVKAWGGKGKK